ncbi:MAG TPA: hypothetical protein VG324_06325 [Blastocatellia bacterium]|nr:hypothetical protein [Blastocatellia bacterium]
MLIWNFTSPKAHDLLHTVLVSHPLIGERALAYEVAVFHAGEIAPLPSIQIYLLDQSLGIW